MASVQGRFEETSGEDGSSGAERLLPVVVSEESERRCTKVVGGSKLSGTGVMFGDHSLIPRPEARS